MKGIRFDYVDSGCYKHFQTRKAFIEWAQDDAHNGKYYMSYPNMTVTFTREQVLQEA